MKVFLGLSAIVVLLTGGFAYSELQQGKLLSQQIEEYARQNSQLLTQIENNSLQNLASANAVRDLQSELNNRDSQIAALTRQLESLQLQVDPDYQQVESRIRQQLTREIEANNRATISDPRLSALKQLGELDPIVMGEIISLQAQYGEFLKSLNVSDERLEVVVNALHNLIAEQNQTRTEIIQEMQADPQATNRGDMRRQMRAISSPEAQLEALAYDLTESELDAFSDFQEQRQNRASVGVFSGAVRGTGNGPVFISSDVIQGGAGQTRSIQVLPANPAN